MLLANATALGDPPEFDVDTIYLRWRNQATTDLKFYLYGTKSHSSGRFYTRYERTKIIISLS